MGPIGARSGADLCRHSVHRSVRSSSRDCNKLIVPSGELESAMVQRVSTYRRLITRVRESPDGKHRGGECANDDEQRSYTETNNRQASHARFQLINRADVKWIAGGEAFRLTLARSNHPPEYNSGADRPRSQRENILRSPRSSKPSAPSPASHARTRYPF